MHEAEIQQALARIQEQLHMLTRHPERVKFPQQDCDLSWISTNFDNIWVNDKLDNLCIKLWKVVHQPEKPIGAVERNETRQCGSVLLGMVFGLHLLKKQF